MINTYPSHVKPIKDIRKREVEAFFEFVSTADTERAIKARSYHVLGEYTAADFETTSQMFTDAGGSASFAFLGRDVNDQQSIIETVDDAGHEVVLHGHRHVSFGDLDYDTAYSDLSKGLSSIEDETGIRPQGFFAPFKWSC